MPTPQTRECIVEQLRPELRTAIKQYMSGDDEVLICFETTHTASLMDRLVQNIVTGFEAQVITRRRIINANTGGLYRTLRVSAMNLLDIVNIKESSFGDHYYVMARGHGDALMEYTFGSLALSRRFSDALRKAIDQAQNITTTSSTQSPKSTELQSKTIPVTLHGNDWKAIQTCVSDYCKTRDTNWNEWAQSLARSTEEAIQRSSVLPVDQREIGINMDIQTLQTIHSCIHYYCQKAQTPNWLEWEKYVTQKIESAIGKQLISSRKLP